MKNAKAMITDFSIPSGQPAVEFEWTNAGLWTIDPEKERAREKSLRNRNM